MNVILPCAQAILYTLLDLMPSPYQRLSLIASFALFFEPSNGRMLPEHSVIKSPAAVSRFFNRYGWPTRAVIRATRQQIILQLNKFAETGRRPYLQVMIDLTTLEKRGKFKAFGGLIQSLNHTHGLHIVVMYLVVGQFVISTRPLKGTTITWWGRRRWAIEGFFKTANYQFGLASFGQQTLLGVYRWLILCLISFVLVHGVYLSSTPQQPPQWRQASSLALELLMPWIVVSQLLLDIERKRDLLASLNLKLELSPLVT